MVEIWKQCVRAPDYLVSSDGRVMREKGGRGARAFNIVKQFTPANDDRPTVTIRVDGKTKTFRVCNLILEAFAGSQPEPMQECCHNDGNAGNNKSGNLRWDTRKANHADKNLHGTMPRGAKSPQAKPTQLEVDEIRRSYAAGGITQRELGKCYGVVQAQISRIIRGVRW